jgi:dATP pyrophosphohydrolase
MRAPFQVLVIPYRRTGSGYEFALLRRADLGWWHFVAGGGEDDETPLQAARRETREETGLDGELMPLDCRSSVPKEGFADANCWGEEVYVIPEHAFALDAGDREIVLSAEHRELRWLPYEEARAALRWDGNRTALWELRERLGSAGRGTGDA